MADAEGQGRCTQSRGWRHPEGFPHRRGSSWEAKSSQGLLLLQDNGAAFSCFRGTQRSMLPQRNEGPVWASRWSDSLPVNHLPGQSGGPTTGQQWQRPACFSSPLRKPQPPTLAQSLPSPPGSLNPPLVSQPPTPTKYLWTLLWSTRTRDYFSTEHTGLGLLLAGA